MKLKPYISIDVETTGIDTENDKIIQIGMVFDDLITPVKDLQKWSVLINPQEEEYHGRIQPVALAMNAWIFKEMTSPGPTKYPVMFPNEARKVFQSLLRDFFYKVLNKDARSKEEKKNQITFAGKNLQGFDIPLLRSNKYLTEENRQYVGTRVIDAGSLYLPDFGYVPCLGEINKLIGHEPVSHDALDDAYNVVYAIRKKLGVS